MSSYCGSPFVPLSSNKAHHGDGFFTFHESPRTMETLEIDGKKISGKSIADQEKEKMSQSGGGMNYAYINQSLNCDNIHPEYPQHRYTNANSECPASHHNHTLTRFTLQRIHNSPMFHPLSDDPFIDFATGSHNLTLAAPHISYSVRQ